MIGGYARNSSVAAVVSPFQRRCTDVHTCKGMTGTCQLSLTMTTASAVQCRHSEWDWLEQLLRLQCRSSNINVIDVLVRRHEHSASSCRRWRENHHETLRRFHGDGQTQLVRYHSKSDKAGFLCPHVLLVSVFVQGLKWPCPILRLC